MSRAVAQRQIFAHAIVVLNVPAKLILAILHRRIADALRELRRQSGFKRSEIGELESAEGVGTIVTAITAGFELRAETKSVFFECVVDVVREFKIELSAAPTSLCAAVVERPGNENRLAQTHRACFGLDPASLQPHFIEKLLAEDT